MSVEQFLDPAGVEPVEIPNGLYPSSSDAGGKGDRDAKTGYTEARPADRKAEPPRLRSDTLEG